MKEKPDKKLNEDKKCFFISPIGDEKSDARKRSNKVLKYIINPIVSGFGFSQAERADHLAEPGIITSQIISRIIDDELVIVDLSDHNPNVFYELAIRHMIRQPYIQIIQKKQKIPFDVSVARTIHYDLEDLDNVEQVKKELEKQIQFALSNPDKITNPISSTVNLNWMKTSGNPIEQSLVELSSKIDDLDYKLMNVDGIYNIDDVHDKVSDIGYTSDDIESKVSSIESQLDAISNKLDELE